MCRTPLLPDANEPWPRCRAHDRAAVPRASLEQSDGDPLLGYVVARRFVVLGLVGTGALAAVYRARDLDSSEDVALKVLRADRLIDPSVRERFEREARILCELESPYGAAAVAWGTIDDPALDGTTARGALYLAMELLDGESLGARLQRLGRVEPRDAVRFACHCLHTLAEAHAKGVVHRDIKPDNLLLVARAHDGVEVCRVIDFGLAATVDRVPRSDPPPSVRSSALPPSRRTVQGTPRYMAPEQVAGLPIDARADLYSLGAVLYHMLTGRPPFVDRDASAVLNQHLRTPPPPLREAAPDLDIPSGLESIVMRALAKEPAHRTRSAEVFLQALGAVEPALGRGEARPRAGSLPPLPRGARSGGGRRLALPAAVVAGIGAVALGAVLTLAPADEAPATPRPPTARASADADGGTRRSPPGETSGARPPGAVQRGPDAGRGGAERPPADGGGGPSARPSAEPAGAGTSG